MDSQAIALLTGIRDELVALRREQERTRLMTARSILLEVGLRHPMTAEAMLRVEKHILKLDDL